MEEAYQSAEQYFADISTRIRDMEEKQKLLKDRLLLIGKNLIEDRDDMIKEMQEIKKMTLMMQQTQTHMQDMLRRLTDTVAEAARKEEVAMLSRQLNIFTESLKET